MDEQKYFYVEDEHERLYFEDASDLLDYIASEPEAVTVGVEMLTADQWAGLILEA